MANKLIYTAVPSKLLVLRHAWAGPFVDAVATTSSDDAVSEWWFGSLLCKAIPYLQGVVVGASVNTLGVVAVERYV